MKHETILPSQADCTPVALLVIARQYGAAACQLRERARETGWAPYRLCVLHATELCLSALLLDRGYRWKEICGMQHDLARRADLCAGHGLKLKKRSLMLLRQLSEASAYRGARYELASIADGRHPAQLLALFTDVAEKVCALLRRG